MFKKVMHILSSEQADESSLVQATMPSYAELYETHAQREQNDQATGDGDFLHIGLLELEILKSVGLQPEDRLLDFGCGIGRMAVHALNYLESDKYWGIDISETMLERAKAVCGELHQRGRWLLGDGGVLNTLQDIHFDYICAFSVFTHLDLEEYYTHLQCMRRVISGDGLLLTSHLLLGENQRAKEIFTMSSALPYAERRGQVLNVVSSRELIETVAEMAFWRVEEWIGAEEKRFAVGRDNIPAALGQAIAVLRPVV